MIVGNRSGKDQLHPAARAVIKLALLASFFILIRIAMPYSDNGRLIGKVLCVASVLGVFCLDVQGKIHFSSRREKNLTYLCTVMLAFYYVLIYYHQYKNLPMPLLARISGRYHISERFLSCLLLLAVYFTILPALYSVVCYVLGFTKMCMLQSGRWESRLWTAIPLICGASAMACLFYYSFSRSIWFDETFTMALIQHPWSEIVTLTGQDVHPPLYYLMLKLWMDCFRQAGHILPDLYAARIFSCLPYGVILAACIFRWRRGSSKAPFMLCALFMPNMLEYGVEVRMYSWALFWVLAAFYEGRKIWRGEGKLSSWIAFAAFGLASIYTHYYCGICIAVFSLLLLYRGITDWTKSYASGQDSVRRVHDAMCWLGAILAMIAGYLPWLRVLFTTLSNVSDRTWPAPFSISGIVNDIWCMAGLYGTICFVLPVALMTWTGGKHLESGELYDKVGLLLPLILMLAGEVVSVIYTPVWSFRYVLCTLGVMWFSFAVIASRQRELVCHRILLLMMLVGFMNLFVFARHESMAKMYAAPLAATVQQNDDTAVFWTYNPDTAYVLATAYNRKCILVGRIGDYLEDVYRKNLVVDSDADVETMEEQSMYQYVE